MKSRKITIQDSTEVDMTPMLDIVFIMLIFFIVTTSFVKESGIEFNRPSVETGTKPSQAMLIKVDASEILTINGRVVLAESIQSNVEVSKSIKPNLAVLVQIDKSVRTGLLVRIIDQVRLAGVSQVTVSRISG